MRVLRGIESLRKFLNTSHMGILADTGFLYAATDTDDRLNSKALKIYDLLEEFRVPVYINIISRVEFADLIFRKQLTIGAISVYEKMSGGQNKALFNILKSIRDESTSHLRAGQSYKITEGKLKKLRYHFENADDAAWSEFCKQYVGAKLSNEWQIIEEELGMKFIEVMEGQTSDIIVNPLYWKDMIQIMGIEGLRGPDAMITNFFIKSRIPVLITTDGDIAKPFINDDYEHADKSVFHLE